MTTPHDPGVHVHAWDLTGQQMLDDFFWPVTLDGDLIDAELLRALAFQRAVAHEIPIRLNAANTSCGASILSPSSGWIKPSTKHTCQNCGTNNKTRRRSFFNP